MTEHPMLSWLRATLDAKEATTHAACETDEVESWQWETTETDQSVPAEDLNEALDHQSLSLRSREEIRPDFGGLPHIVIGHVHEYDPALVHIADNDPRSVLARVAADRKILELHTGAHECPSIEDNCGWWPGSPPFCDTVRALAEGHRYAPGFRKEWLDE